MPRARPPQDPLEEEKQRAAFVETVHRQRVLAQARLQELLDEERDLARTAIFDIQTRWVSTLRALKHKELTAEIEVVRHEFEKALDRRNAVNAMLMSDLQEAEGQYRVALRTHLNNVDELVDLQAQRVHEMDAHFDAMLTQMKRDHDVERAEILRRNALEVADVKLVLQNLQAEAEREDRRQQEETSESHDTAVEKMEEEKKQMQAEMQKLTGTLRSQIAAHYNDYNNSANKNIKEYTDLLRQDKKSARDIEAQMRKIHKLQETIATWKSNLSNTIRECEERNAAMRAEKEAVAAHHKALKDKMLGWRKQQERLLADLVTEARAAEDALHAQSEDAERILTLVGLCQGLETDRERVLGFDSDVTAQEASEDVARRVQRFADQYGAESGGIALSAQELVGPRPTDLTAPPAEEWRLLERFWLRYNKVVLDNAAIAQERHHLENENSKLRQLLKQYLDGISVNAQVMASDNNLLMASKMHGAVAPGGGSHAGAAAAAASAPAARTALSVARHGTLGGAGGNVPAVDGRKVYLETVKQRAR